jgi:tol-pal system protein YbgF
VVPESALRDLPRPAPESIAPPPRTANLPPQQQYDAAMQLLRAGDYAGAEGGLQLFLEINPQHALAPNAAYWLAESHYVRKSYAAAAAAFARNYRVYGKDDTKAPDNLLKLGMSLQGLQETEKACRTFAELAKEFPNAPAHIQQAVSRERERADCA